MYGINKNNGFLQILILLGIVAGCCLIGMLLSGLVLYVFYGTNFSTVIGIVKSNANLNGLRFAQMISTICFFLLPALIFSKLRNKNILKYTDANKIFPLIGFLLIPLILYFFYPIINLSFFVNKIMPWINWNIKDQHEYKTLIDAILKDKSYFVFGLNFIMIALLPAICEEWIFRGVVQKFFSEYINIHISIFVTSIIFSLIHNDFAAFLPRIILSMLLGYVFYISGSLWASIFLHAVNNGAQVILMYCNNTGIYKSDMDNPEMPKNWELFVYTLVFYALMSIFYYFCKRKKA